MGGLNRKSLGGKLQEKLTYVAGAARPTVQYFGDRVNDAVETAKPGVHYVGEQLSSAAEAAKPKIHYVGEQLSSAAEAAKPKVQYVGEHLSFAAGAAQSGLERVGKEASATAESASKSFEHFTTAAETAHAGIKHIGNRLSSAAETLPDLPTVQNFVSQKLANVAECASDKLCAAADTLRAAPGHISNLLLRRGGEEHPPPVEIEMNDFFDVLSEGDSLSDSFWEFIDDEEDDNTERAVAE